MILFKNGIEIKRIIGYHEKAELLNEIFSSNDSGSNNGGRIITISESNFTSATSKGLVLVDFTASWCGWCKKLHPILEEIAAENSSKLTVAQIDADKNTSVVRKYEIEGYPTMLLFKDGKLVKTIVGYKDKANLLKEIEPYF